MRNWLATLLVPLMMLSAVSCGGPGWEEALEQSAPPEPNRLVRRQAAAVESEETAPAPAEEQQTESTEEPAPSGTKTPEDAAARPAVLQVSLPDYPQCHVGAVRFYVNRRYVGAFDDKGNLRVEVTAGELTLEAWDSGGHWITRYNALPGETANIALTCAMKNRMDEPQE